MTIHRELDIRQSDDWGEFLTSLGWITEKTSSGVAVHLKKIAFGSVVKVQRPHALSRSDLKELVDLCKKFKAMFVKVEPDYTQDISVMKSGGFHENPSPYLPPTTVFLDLTKSEEDLWGQLSHSCKYSINRAKREEARVEFYPNPSQEIVQKFQDICVETGKLKHFYISPLSEQQAKVKAFKDKAVIGLVYDKDGAVVGGKLYLGFNDMVLYNMGGTSTIGRHQKAGYLLVWESLLYLKKLGYKVFDQEGKDDKRFPFFTSNWGGFSHFKEKFGGEVVEFPVPYIYYISPVLKLISKISPIQV